MNLVNLRLLVLLHRSVTVGFRVGGVMWDAAGRVVQVSGIGDIVSISMGSRLSI